MPIEYQRLEFTLHLYGWDTKKGFKWTINSTYGPFWINIDTILCVWKPRKGSKSKTMTIPEKHIEFVKDILARIADRENNIKNDFEVEDGDGHEKSNYGCWLKKQINTVNLFFLGVPVIYIHIDR